MIYIYIFILLFITLLLFLFYASYSIQAGVYTNAFCRKKTNEKIVALTFDDGPDAVQTPKILHILKDYGINATFFCIGDKIAGKEKIIRQINEEGHHIGNHSYSHAGSFPFYPTGKMKEDLLHCQRTLENILHKKTTWFRPPFGVTNPTVAKVIKELDYKMVGWNIRTLDTRNQSHEKTLKRIKKRLKPGSVILLHDRMPESDKLLLKILHLLKERSYQVVSLEKMM